MGRLQRARAAAASSDVAAERMRFAWFLGRGKGGEAGWRLRSSDDRRLACVVGVDVVLVSY